MRMILKTGLPAVLLLALIACGKRSADTPPPPAPSAAESAQPAPSQEKERRLSELPPPEPKAEPAPWFIQVDPPETEIIITRRAEVILQTNSIPPNGLTMTLDPGEYDLHLHAPGFSAYKERLIIRKNQQPLFYNLRRLTGEVRIKSNAGVSLLLESAGGETRREGVTTAHGLFETRLPEGDYQVTCSKADYYPATHAISVRQSVPVFLDTPLEGMPASLILNAQAPIEIREGEILLGPSGVIITNLPPGAHTFTLLAEGYRPATLTADLPPNRFTALSAPPLIPTVGALTIRLRSSLSNDACFANAPKTLTVGPHTLQQTRETALIKPMPCGTHTVTVQVAGYRSAQELPAIEILDGRTQTLEHVLTPLPATLLIQTTPLPADVRIAGEKRGRTGETISIPPFQPLTITLSRDGFHDVTLNLPPLDPGASTNLQAALERAVILEDLLVNLTAEYAAAGALAPGSREALQRQKQLVRTRRLPLEVTTRAGSIPLRLIPPGSFRMGSPFTENGRNDDETQPLSEEVEDPQPDVKITTAFYLGKYEITQRQWREIMGTAPSSMQHAGPDAPVENVSWEECSAFAARLCELGKLPPGTYRLPTEAEWEYACRAGTEQPTYLGTLSERGMNNAPLLDRIAWYAGNCGVDYPGGMPSEAWPEKQYPHQSAGPHPVGQKLPNAWGLHDTLGNVWEWCRDYYKSSYAPGPLENPSGPEKGASRVCRGGGWYTRASRFRAAERYANSPKYRDNNLGLRILRVTPAVTLPAE